MGFYDEIAENICDSAEEIEKLKKQIKELEAENTAIKKRAEAAEKDWQIAEERIKDLDLSVTMFKSANEELKKQAEDKNRTIQQLRDQKRNIIKNLENENTVQAERIKDLETDYKTLESRYKTMSELSAKRGLAIDEAIDLMDDEPAKKILVQALKVGE